MTREDTIKTIIDLLNDENTSDETINLVYLFIINAR